MVMSRPEPTARQDLVARLALRSANSSSSFLTRTSARPRRARSDGDDRAGLAGHVVHDLDGRTAADHAVDAVVLGGDGPFDDADELARVLLHLQLKLRNPLLHRLGLLLVLLGKLVILLCEISFS